MSQSNFFAVTARWVSKMTGKAKAALEEKTMWTSLKKRKPEASGETINPLPKKAKTNRPADTTPPGMTVSLPLTSPIPVTSVTPTPPLTDKSHCAVVCTEEEEEALYADRSDADPKESDKESQSGEKEQDPQDKLKHLMQEWVSPVYAFFHPTPNIVEIGGWRAHEFKCQAKGCKAKV
ncbi:uncharacterized protein HD556DRAFT_1457539 [Suillus plorans]|uniref:Uncharacterized protein n=1 Tax=Suillus plorans TaxID=116603 RepID=A0A9P7ACB2_9AGAM|nr:uncharacterized protein HD556DRAFT_1457539 [Suillus plorans]KAG1785525.1 hypothetical protein HD556DRAFT_1457539 [Suillus plorans]